MSEAQRVASKAPRGLNMWESVKAVTQMAPGSERAAAEQIVHRFSLLGSATSLIPVPLADLAAVAALQVTMLSKLAKVYGTDFHHQRARQIISTLIGTVVPASLTNLTGRVALGLGSLIGAGSTVLRFAPVIGVPAMAYFTFASTKTLGLLFIEHFEAGGTLLDFDADAKAEQFRNGVGAAQAERARADVDVAVATPSA
ncbi:MAG: DUF697 domain-containing protein [Rhodospirillales bacterium]|nr:DUF697 domain-containing protein [Rhodospirillales bacterium]